MFPVQKRQHLLRRRVELEVILSAFFGAFGDPGSGVRSEGYVGTGPVPETGTAAGQHNSAEALRDEPPGPALWFGCRIHIFWTRAQTLFCRCLFLSCRPLLGTPAAKAIPFSTPALKQIRKAFPCLRLWTRGRKNPVLTFSGKSL